MYTLDALVQDVAQRRGQVQKAGELSPADFAEVWNAFAKYAGFCMEQRRGLTLSSFCKMGWQLEKKLNGASYRPFFQLSEQFCRAYLNQEALRKVGAQAASANELCPFEDFNFSKAAIRFSQQLTKDQVFTGLRSLVQRLGEAIGEGKEIEVSMGEMGKLVCRMGEPRFVFAQEIYTKEGLDPPPGAPAAGALRTAAAFSREAPAGSRALGLRGSRAAPAAEEPPAQRAPPSPMAESLPDEAPNSMGYSGFRSDELPLRPSQATPSRRSLMSSGSAPNLGNGSDTPAVLTTQQYKRELAYKEAMDRHITAMEARANEVVQEREHWQDHVQTCLEQERDEIQQRRMRNQQNLHFLQHQMALGEEKKKEQRRDDIVSASAHEFPKFTEPQAHEMRDFVRGQQVRMRSDLDDQVRTNNTLRNVAKQRERALEVNQLETNRQEMSMLRNAERAKKAYDREALATAWNSEIRMKNIWKAIETHNKVGANDASDSMPPSRGGSAVSAGRIMTGSTRRAPLGASNSLSRLNTGSVR
mmetsp:Transcript_24395/g.69945  ORF Transcript_24395/g.69945 Transcript_24395/m.69945 type:complete len:529 (+) Transcript_24395:74-1660(+)